MKAPAGTSLNTLLRTSHTEYAGPWAGTDCAPSERASTTSANSTNVGTRFVTFISLRGLTTALPSTMSSCGCSSSVRQILAWPDRVSDPQQLLAGVLAQRVPDQQMILAAVRGDLQHLDGGLLEEMDGVEVLGVDLTERRRRRQRAHARLGLGEVRRRGLDASREFGGVRLLELVPQTAEGQVVGRVLDVAVNRPQRLRVRFLGGRERGPRRCQRGPRGDGGGGPAHRGGLSQQRH